MTGQGGIILYFCGKMVDQSTLPPEDRIPDCLEGIPVQMVELPLFPDPEGPHWRSEWDKGTECNYNNTHEHRLATMERFHNLFWEYPTILGLGDGDILDENGNPTGQVGIIMYVTEEVDPKTLRENFIIPDCIDGVPIQILSGILQEVM